MTPYPIERHAADEWQITDSGLFFPRFAKQPNSRRVPPDAQEVKTCERWLLEYAKKTKRAGRDSSYGLKHAVERAYGGYVSNGAFIQAARNLGFTIYVVGPHSPNCVFNLVCDWQRVEQAFEDRRRAMNAAQEDDIWEQ